MEVMILSADSHEQARSQIEAGLNKIASILGPQLGPRKRGFLPNAKASFAVVIDGDTLRHALSDELKPMFLNLGTQCETVVCCRVSPAQKALTVKLVKEGRNAMTLSIGDGANDVAMIQEANIGCGLFGLEGSQAAMSADYAFGQFRYLTKLLLVHGRWSYQRISDMHGNFFYKITFILLYNLLFTSLPVIVLGGMSGSVLTHTDVADALMTAFDQDINAKAALAFPQLYVRGIRGLEYTRAKFWMYMLDGLYQSTIVFFFPYFVWSLGLAVSWNGKGIDSLADFGTTVAVAAIFAANAYALSYSDGSALLTTHCAAPRFLYKFVAQVYFPLDKDIVREAWVMGDLKDQLGIRHRNPKKNTISAILNLYLCTAPAMVVRFPSCLLTTLMNPRFPPQVLKRVL
ncbi:phospholipid-transporting ATPase [Salix suchowensis]|nr:phospholipid-transporting ATPase [Salix suchowensis]